MYLYSTNYCDFSDFFDMGGSHFRERGFTGGGLEKGGSQGGSRKGGFTGGVHEKGGSQGVHEKGGSQGGFTKRGVHRGFQKRGVHVNPVNPPWLRAWHSTGWDRRMRTLDGHSVQGLS